MTPMPEPSTTQESDSLSPIVLPVSNVRYPWRCMADETGVWVLNVRTLEERNGSLVDGAFREDPDA